MKQETSKERPCDSGWLQAAVAWELCASIHAQFAEGKDALFSTRQADFIRHAAECREVASTEQRGM